MKKLLLLSAAAFITASLLSYSFKQPEPKLLTPECYISCFNNETREMIQADAMVIDAFNLMEDNAITQVVVVDGNQYKGIIHLHDILKEGIV